MTDARTLEEAFLDDHRVVTRGLHALQQAVERGDFATARSLATELDAVAGPHMEFEERYYYPTLVDILGREFVDKLYAEHACGQRAVRALAAADQDPELSRTALLEDLGVAMDHVLSCGSLTSHLAALDDSARDRLTAQLEATQRAGRRWTELTREPEEDG